MLDERTRMIEQQLATTESARIRGRTEGLAEGIEQGRAEGEISAFTKLVHSGVITKEIAAAGLGISVSEFEKYL